MVTTSERVDRRRQRASVLRRLDLISERRMQARARRTRRDQEPADERPRD